MNQEFLDMLAENAYEEVRLLPTGEYAALRKMMFTYSLCHGIDWCGISERWCYQTKVEALVALSRWDGVGDPPGMWIVHKGGKNEADRPNPRRG